MKYGFVSDVHGDPEGLQRALESLHQADAIYSLGDVCGGRQVEECIQLMRSRNVLSVSGNHDLWDFEVEGLSQASREYLSRLPLQRPVDDGLAVHSDYHNDQGQVHFPYIHSERDARQAFEHFPQRRIFFGHTHLSQFHRLTPEGHVVFCKATAGTPIQLDPASRYLINVGMACQATLIYDSSQQTISYWLLQATAPPTQSPPRPKLSWWQSLLSRLGPHSRTI